MKKKKLSKLLVLGVSSACMMGSSAQGFADTASSSDQSMDSSTPEQACKGKNSCKGKGGCKTDSHECKGKNSCKGQGGCKTRHMLANNMAHKRDIVL